MRLFTIDRQRNFGEHIIVVPGEPRRRARASADTKPRAFRLVEIVVVINFQMQM